MQIEPGMRSIEVEDWVRGGSRQLELDPDLPPNEQAERLFKQARKLRRAQETVAQLLDAERAVLEYLLGVETQVQQLGDTTDQDRAVGRAADVDAGLCSFPAPDALAPGHTQALLEITEELVGGGYIKARAELALADKAARKAKKGSPGASKRAGGAEAGLRSFTSPGGFRVLVGRNNRQNDELSLRVAKPKDLWFHARDIPGAHVVLRTSGGNSEPGEEDLQFAASLAAYYSKARNDLRFPVTMCSAGQVRKPSGAPPGLVSISEGGARTLTGFPDKVRPLVGADSTDS